MASLGYTTRFEDLDSITADAFMIIDALIDELRAKTANTEGAKNGKRGD